MTDQTNRESTLSNSVRLVLLTGVVASCLCLVLGLIIVLIRHEPRPMGPPPPLAKLFSGIRQGKGLGFLELGLIVLMLTPVARVGVLTVGWSLSRDWKFAGIAGFVLLLLISSILLGTG